MGVGAFLEPLIVVVLLFGGTWINRSPGTSPRQRVRQKSEDVSRGSSPSRVESDLPSPTASDGLLEPPSPSPAVFRLHEDRRHQRRIGIFGQSFAVRSPSTTRFQENLLSRLLRKLPFLVECWYWVLIYWTYQLGRAFTTVTLKEGTVNVARKHALQVIWAEQKLGIFWEVLIQGFFVQRPQLMMTINRLYSFIHIPGSIAFLVWLYYHTATRHLKDLRKPGGAVSASSAGPSTYQNRRRTMATSNLFAFIIFTLWPCMPPRLLSDPDVQGPEGELSRSYGFMDTVHGSKGASSVWTQNRFCNQYAAMPSMHFGYSLMIGLTLMTIPLRSRTHSPVARYRWARAIGLPACSWSRMVFIAAGVAYPTAILVAIVATANHFILDAVAGALVCALGWRCNSILLNLLPLEDYFLWILRLHKPDPAVVLDDQGGKAEGVLPKHADA